MRLVSQQVQHATHTFQWRISDKKRISVTCNKAGTVEESLRRSPHFRQTKEKNKNKELVIVMDGRAISSHCPCSLIGDGDLIVNYVKAGQKQNQNANGSVHCRRKSGELVNFNVMTKGGKNVAKIMKNPAINKLVQEVTVNGYKGEKVKKALKRDGRFRNDMFKKNCVLCHISTEVNTEMSNLVDDLDGKTYKIMLLNKCDSPYSAPSSLEDAYTTENDSQSGDNNENQDPQQSTADKSVSDNLPKKKRKLDNHAAPREILCEKTNLNIKKKTDLSKVYRKQNVAAAEFGKPAHAGTDVIDMKKMMALTSNVCQVRINGLPRGSGFLLFDKYVLTNAHVVQDVNSKYHQRDKITVDFSYESRGQMLAETVVEEVVVCEYSKPFGKVAQYDWSLLKLSSDQNLPDGLLTQFGFPPECGTIHIFGHPNGVPKQIDTCVIIPPAKRHEAVTKHLNEYEINLDRTIDESDAIHPDDPLLTYHTSCFYGSSGSPVFDNYGRVVAMHSGGYPYLKNGEQQSIMEFAYHLSFVIKRIVVGLVQRRRFDVLKAYLACKYAGHETIMNNVKELVESTKDTTFQNAVKSLEAGNNEHLKWFFAFFCQNDQPESMDID